jgi:hypothetical protein
MYNYACQHKELIKNVSLPQWGGYETTMTGEIYVEYVQRVSQMGHVAWV